MCDLEIPLGKWIMPIFEVPDKSSTGNYLTHLVNEGIKNRYGEISEEKKESRLDYELSVILKKKYETYFLIVADFVNWAKYSRNKRRSRPWFRCRISRVVRS